MMERRAAAAGTWGAGAGAVVLPLLWAKAAWPLGRTLWAGGSVPSSELCLDRSASLSPAHHDASIFSSKGELSSGEWVIGPTSNACASSETMWFRLLASSACTARHRPTPSLPCSRPDASARRPSAACNVRAAMVRASARVARYTRAWRAVAVRCCSCCSSWEAHRRAVAALREAAASSADCCRPLDRACSNCSTLVRACRQRACTASSCPCRPSSRRMLERSSATSSPAASAPGPDATW
mmetsp:Transcript_19330/g.41814  ORF Transcript_19330/g.41814 Transcript_19330/m.41814 type:complete len:240 (+) Transcript_19330:424-1143(+)